MKATEKNSACPTIVCGEGRHKYLPCNRRRFSRHIAQSIEFGYTADVTGRRKSQTNRSLHLGASTVRLRLIAERRPEILTALSLRNCDASESAMRGYMTGLLQVLESIFELRPTCFLSAQE